MSEESIVSKMKKEYEGEIKTFEEWTKILAEKLIGIKIITSNKVKAIRTERERNKRY